jgi:hypothetical protein
MEKKDTANEKASGLQSEGSEKNTTNVRKFSPKSTATEAQYSRIVTMLRTGSKNTMEFRRAGIMSPASRIKELNDCYGFYISSNPIDLWDEWGYCHKGVALYELIDEPVSKAA